MIVKGGGGDLEAPPTTKDMPRCIPGARLPAPIRGGYGGGSAKLGRLDALPCEEEEATALKLQRRRWFLILILLCEWTQF